MAGEIDVSRTEDDSTCLDLSIKQIWLIVRYPVSDPGNEFEIVSDKQLVGDSWETLERGVQVIIAYGNAKVQATVLAVSGNDAENPPYVFAFTKVRHSYVEWKPFGNFKCQIPLMFVKMYTFLNLSNKLDLAI